MAGNHLAVQQITKEGSTRMMANGGSANYENIETRPFTISELDEVQSGWTNKEKN